MGAREFSEYRPRQSKRGTGPDERRCVVVSSTRVPNPHRYGVCFEALTVVFLTDRGERASTTQVPSGRFNKQMERTGRVLSRCGDSFLVDALLSMPCVHDETAGVV